jgi:hypothetical protein
MKLTHDELAFLSAWAREEWEPACYRLPSHRLQLDHGVSGAQLLVFIKAWTEGEGIKALDILGVAANPQPCWPWSTAEYFSPSSVVAGPKTPVFRRKFLFTNARFPKTLVV